MAWSLISFHRKMHYMRIRAAVLLCIFLAGLSATNFAGATEAAKYGGQAKSLEDVLSHWTIRHSQLASGRFELVLKEPFALESFAGEKTDSSTPPANSIVVSLHDDRYRLDGECRSNLNFGVSFTSWDEWNEKRSRERRFQAALYSRFEGDYSGSARQPYTAIITERKRIEWWQPRADAFSKCVVTAAHDQWLLANLPGLLDTPLTSGVFDSFRLAIHPRLLQHGSAEGATLIDEHPRIGGRECVVLEEPLPHTGGKTKRRLWVDPSKGFVVVRCFLHGADGALRRQVDVEYEPAGDELWLPRTIKILRMDDDDEAIFDDLSFAVKPVGGNIVLDASLFELDMPVDTWVIDRVADESYVIGSGQKKQFVTASGVASVDSYDELLSVAKNHGAPRVDNVVAVLLSYIVWAVTWPRILVTFIAPYAAIRFVRAFLVQQQQPARTPPTGDEST